MLDYIIKVLLFQTLFLAVYDIFLKRETFFQWNRIYLLLTSLLAYVVPLLKINRITEVVSQEYLVYLPEVILTPATVIKQQLDWSTLLFTALRVAFWAGMGFALLLFALKLYKLFQLIVSNEKVSKRNYWLVLLDNSKAFSFFNYIFLSKTISAQTKQQIIEHELVHVQQKHSLDLLVFEIQRIVCWFNPFSYIYQSRISELHEFIADAKAIKAKDSTHYFNSLLSQTFDSANISFINPFFNHSLLKKRIKMLRKNKSKQLLKFKYVLLLPLLMGMLIYTSCEKSDTDIANINKKRSVSIFMGNGNKIKKAELKNKKKEGYFDLYMFGAIPEGKEIRYNDLSSEEKLEYDNFESIFSEIGKGNISYKIYEDKNGKRALLQKIEWKGMVRNNIEPEEILETEEVTVSFANIKKSPIFPGCEDVKDQKKCFQESIRDHVNKNFDASIANSLNIDAGKKRVYVQFKVDKNGNVTDIRSRGPHESLEKEALRVIKLLPTMQPGEQNGKKVGVKYTLPITFKVY